MHWDNYHIMSSVEETVQQLSEAAGSARIVAGGTDFFVQAREQTYETRFTSLLDITRIESLREIQADDTHLTVGAAATMADLAVSPLVWEKARALAQGAKWVGSPQIRAVATVGGNVVNAMPAADTAVPLVALGAEAHILSPAGGRFEPVESLFLGVGKSAVDASKELVTHFRIPLCSGPRRASAMQRLAKRKAFTLPQLSCAVWVNLDDRLERFDSVRIVAAPLATTPWRVRSVEDQLAGASISRDTVQPAADMACEWADARDSLRACAGYRKDMVAVLIRRALSEALEQLNAGFDDA